VDLLGAKTGKRSRNKRGSKKKLAKKSGPVPEKQWEMPAGFCADGSTQATLREVVDPDQPTLQLSDLTLEQRAQLVTRRLELQKEINLAMIGAGMIDKARAITEVKNKTKVGRLLIEIEQQMIRNLIEQSQDASAATGSKARRSAPATTKSHGGTTVASKSRSKAAASRSRSKAAKASGSRRTSVAKTKSRGKAKR